MSTEKPTYDEIFFVYQRQTKIYDEVMATYAAMMDLGMFALIIFPIRSWKLTRKFNQLCKLHSYFSDWHNEIGDQFRATTLKEMKERNN
jgi:hypothetical protein